MARTDNTFTEKDGSYIKTIWSQGRNWLINGANKYLNFNSISGETGYGIRDNGGTLQAKNSGGSWANLGVGGGQANTASNLGLGEGVFKQKTGVDLEFKTLIGGSGITLSSDGNEVTVDADGGGTTVDHVSNVATDTILGRITASSGNSEELTPAQVRTLINVADGATPDQDLSGKQNILDEGAFVNGDKTKLDTYSEANQTTNNAKVTYPSADATKVGHITVTQAVNLDTMESDIANKANTADLATVATSGDYDDLSNKPDLSAFDNISEHANEAAFPGTGAADKFYLAQDTGILYRWTGSAYAIISAQLALGETSSTAYRGDRGKTAFDHVSTTNNPHSVSKSQVGLALVPNVDARARASHTGTQLASTISNFAATVRATILTGLSTATSTAVTAADTILVAIGKLQAQVNLKSNSASPTFTGTVVLPANTVTNSMIAGTGTRNSTTFYRGDGTFAVPPGAGGSGNYFNDEQIDQSGGTSDTYGALAGTINGTNRVFTVSTGVYQTGTLTVYLNGQLQTQGTGQDWVETTPASGTFTFAMAPPTGSEITVVYQSQVLSSDTVVVTTTAQTLEDKRIKPRVSSSASGNITPTKVDFDRYIRTGLSADITISNPTMDIGEVVAIQLSANGVGRAITFGTHYMALDGLALPTTTTASKVMSMVLEKVTATKVLVSYVNEA